MTNDKAGKRAGLVTVMAVLALSVWVAPVGAQESVRDGKRVVTLEEALRMALERNRDLEVARLGLEAADGQVREAWGGVMPRLDLTSSYTRNLTVPKSFVPALFFDPNAEPGDVVPVQFGADNQWSFNLQAEQPLFQAAAIIGVGAAARYRALQAEVVRGRAQDVATRVRIAYYDVLLAQEAERLNAESARRVRQVLDETSARNRAGLASDYDVLRLEVELANIEPNLRRARNAVDAAKRGLGVELALEDLETLEVEGTLASMDLRLIAENDPANRSLLQFAGMEDPETAVDEARIRESVQYRSDVRQLELTANLREAEVRAERAEYLPRVAVFGTYSINAQHNDRPEFFGGSNAPRAYGRQVGLQVTLPVFNGFKRPARLDQKSAVLRQARAEHRLTVARAESQVRTLLDQVQEARLRAAAQHRAVDQARQGFRIASVQYREGISSQLEVTDAEVALRQSEFNYAEAVYDYLVARARLDEATGMVPLVDTRDRVALGR